jgi:hypothetical protein
MKKALRKAAAKAPPRSKKAPTRRLVLAKAPAETMSPDEVVHLETLAKRFEESEKAWQRMTAPAEEGDSWTQVEEHLLQGRGDAERRWKFFSK